MNTNEITSINEIETDAGVFKNLIYDGAVEELYAILNLEKPPKFLYFIPKENYYNEYTEANLVMIKTSSIIHVDACDVPSDEDYEEDNDNEENDESLFTEEDLRKVLTPEQLEELNIKDNKRLRDMYSFNIEKGLPECLTDLGKNIKEEKPVVFFRDEVI